MTKTSQTSTPATTSNVLVPSPGNLSAPVPAPTSSPASVSFGFSGGSVSIPLLGGSRMTIIVPPGGFAGFAQQTPAVQAMFQRAGRKGGKRSAAKRRRTKKKAAGATRKRRRASSPRKRARLVKGSAAAKRYMASIRRKRKRG